MALVGGDWKMSGLSRATSNCDVDVTVSVKKCSITLLFMTVVYALFAFNLVAH